MNLLSYGAGVNSTALAILLCEGKISGIAEDWDIVFADTRDEKPETYTYIEKVFKPYLTAYGRTLNIVSASEGVLERWQRKGVTGSRLIRDCTIESKIKPVATIMQSGDIKLIGFDAYEAHRAKERPDSRYPLLELNIDRDGCEQIIRDAGLCVPFKSGCWHCPFSRVNDIIALVQNHPDKFQMIVDLEEAAKRKFGDNAKRCQWHDRPATYWRARALAKADQGSLDLDYEPPIRCECYDG